MVEKLVAQLLIRILPLIALVGIVSMLPAVFRTFLLPKLKGRAGEAEDNVLLRRSLDQSV